jgi:hypothetical protein
MYSAGAAEAATAWELAAVQTGRSNRTDALVGPCVAVSNDHAMDVKTSAGPGAVRRTAFNGPTLNCEHQHRKQMLACR